MCNLPQSSDRPPDEPLLRPVPIKAAGHRVLHVNVPCRIFELAKAKAYMLGTPWPEFVVQLLTEATADLAAGTPLA
jgi:hypothetical protein